MQLDASFSPIKRVSFTVDAARVNQKVNLDKLNLATGGQFSMAVPKYRPFSVNASLISFNDLRRRRMPSDGNSSHDPLGQVS
jgi:hypothetical protein